MMARTASKSRHIARLLFVSSNGVGMGHLSRLLAVARRLPNSAEAVFLSMSQGFPVVQQFGFHAEYFPSHHHTLSDVTGWNSWLEATLRQILDAYAIQAVVLDGNVVYPGIRNATSRRPDCQLIWIRRGMWRKDQDNVQSLESAQHVDFIIEPDDVASDLDSGASPDQRRGVTAVDPIRLLDSDEILSRTESCHALGLDPNSRFVLIQLGAGNNYNYIDLINTAIQILEPTGAVQPVIAEWLTSDLGFNLWPNVPRLRCFPISRYYRSFDFTISAAGYNSFNEIISFGIPAVLAPNLNRSMDDQQARAAYADLHGAAVHLDGGMVQNLKQVLTAMLDQNRLQTMSDMCRQIARPNGALRAAQLIADAATEAGRR